MLFDISIFSGLFCGPSPNSRLFCTFVISMRFLFPNITLCQINTQDICLQNTIFQGEEKNRKVLKSPKGSRGPRVNSMKILPK